MSQEQTHFETAFAQGYIHRLRTAFWVYDFDEKRVVWANQAALEVWQAESLEELSRRDLGADMSPSVKRRLNQYREDFAAFDASFSELWTLYPRGKPLTLHVVFRGFPLEDGRLAMLCEGTETEVATAETLRSADALLHTSVMTSLFELSGQLLYRNPAARIAYGGNGTKLEHQFANIADWQTFLNDLQNDAMVKQTVQMKTLNGRRWHEVTACRCNDAVTGRESILISEIDISEMKAAEQRLRDFADVSSDWFWEMDSDLRYTWFSDNVRLKTGVPADWHYGKTRQEILSPDNDGNTIHAHLEVLRARKPFRDFRLLRRGPDGDRWLSSSGKPIFDQDGNFLGYRGNGSDISDQVETERKIAEQRELEVALAKEREINGLQRQFVSMVSHEFRTPLAVIDSSAQRLLRRIGKLPQERMVDALQKVRRSVARLTELMESVLNAARLEEGRIAYEPSPCDLAAIIREIGDSYAEVYAEHSIELDIDALTDPITADSKLIRQVISNLTSNAVKYSPAGTLIRIKAWQDQENGCCAVSVQDEGVGIPKSELGKLCSRFFRASTSTGIAGTGIGLHLVQHFVALHGGTIDVESEEGKGSVFTVRLPMELPSEETALLIESTHA